MHYGAMNFLFVLLLVFSLPAQAKLCFSLNSYETSTYSFEDGIIIPMGDGVRLHANLFRPKQEGISKVPTIIFANSWAVEEHEYIFQARLLAEAGFQVLSYSARGWGCSGGQVNVVGPQDMQDLKHIIDWLERHTSIDTTNIGMAGISYGGGLALMAAAMEPRIKTVAAMSAWGSLEEAIYHQNTPRLFWGSALMLSGWLTGELDTALLPMFKNLVTHKQTEEVLRWARKRSPVTYVEAINSAKKPIYLSNNFGDNLFQVNNILNFFHKLRSPKLLDLNQGTHATGEISGLYSSKNYTFKRVKAWFEYWLQGKPAGSLIMDRITVQTDLKHLRESFDLLEWKNRGLKRLHFHSRNFFSMGSLKEKAQLVPDQDVLFSGKDTLASTGIPLLSAIVDGHIRAPLVTWTPIMRSANGVFYQSQPLNKKFSIRGIPKIKLTAKSEADRFQLVAYLYAVNPAGVATLITHGAKTVINEKSELSMELVGTAFDIPADHRIAVAIDTQDPLYAQPLGWLPYKTTIYFGNANNFLELPIKN